MTIREQLFERADKNYAAFQAKLTPTVDAKLFIGVRVPAARTLAKRIYRSGTYHEFLSTLPHTFFDENMLHVLIISEYQDFPACIAQVDRFLPYIDNWAVCDTLSPKIFAQHKAELMEKILAWTNSDKAYTARFSLEMLMTHFLDDDFRPEYLAIPAQVRLDDYYAKMMVAWFFATALAKQWRDTIPFIETGALDPWTHNKTIQKARESYRITPQQKEYLKSLKVPRAHA